MRNQVILRRATTGRPYKIRMKSVHRDDVKITRKCAYFCDLLAFFVVGATSGRPLFIHRTDKIKTPRQASCDVCGQVIYTRCLRFSAGCGRHTARKSTKKGCRKDTPVYLIFGCAIRYRALPHRRHGKISCSRGLQRRTVHDKRRTSCGRIPAFRQAVLW